MLVKIPMKRADLTYSFPEELIATVPSRPTRVMFAEKAFEPVEISLDDLIRKIPAGDVFVINTTQVIKRRVFAGELEILFLNQVSVNKEANEWSVLFPSKKLKLGEHVSLPGGFSLELIEKGRPQRVKITPAITQKNFDQFAELPLPPYIQKARNNRHATTEDTNWYQTAWAKDAGSFAAPTASLHFSKMQIQQLIARDVQVIELVLHVGLGTFLPVLTEDLNDHTMHEEFYEISQANWDKIINAKKDSRGIWSLGTTTTRVLESVARTGVLTGSTDILLQEGSEFKIVDRLLTNFHQPESTLLALVAGFAGLKTVKHNYCWAVARKFKLFSYGDLSVWIKP